MQVRRIAAIAALGVVAAGAFAPATAAPKSLTKTYAMQLLPVPDPPQGTPSCSRRQLEGVSIHSETIKTTGAGTLSVKVSGFSGDWDITVFDGEHGEEGVGDGTSTGAGAPATAGMDTYVQKFKKAQTIQISICNFAGSPSATGSYTYKYK